MWSRRELGVGPWWKVPWEGLGRGTSEKVGRVWCVEDRATPGTSKTQPVSVDTSLGETFVSREVPVSGPEPV